MTQKTTSEDGQSNTSTSSGSSTTSALAQAASTGKDVIQSGVRELSGEVSHMASGIADEAKKAAETKIGAGKDFAVEQLSSVADALRKTGKSLGSDNVATGYIEKAAGSVDTVSEYFQTRTLSQLINDVEGYARREPAVFLGGAFFVGMLGGRFLKAASPAHPDHAQGANHGSSSQGSRHGNDGPRASQGNRQGGNGRNPPSHGQHQGAPMAGGQGNKGGQGQGQGQKSAAVATGSASSSSSANAKDSPSGNDKPGSDSGSKGAEGATRPGKTPGAS